MGHSSLPPEHKKAIGAMKEFGFSPKLTHKVLKKLIKLFEDNWCMIEENNYAVLVDALLENRANDTHEDEEEHVPVTRSLNEQGRRQPQSSTSGLNHQLSPRKSKYVEESSEDSLEPMCGKSRAGIDDFNEDQSTICLAGKSILNEEPLQMQSSQSTAQAIARLREEEPSTSGAVTRAAAYNQSSMTTRPTEQQHSPRTFIDKKQKSVLEAGSALVPLKRPKTEPMENENFLVDQDPLQVIDEHACLRSATPRLLRKPKEEPFNEEEPEPNGMVEPPPVIIPLPGPAQGFATSYDDNRDLDDNLDKTETPHRDSETRELASIPESIFSYDIASTSLGEVKLAISCDTSRAQRDLRVPNIEDVLKLVEERTLRSYKILDPGFSIVNLMKDMCQNFLELATEQGQKMEEVDFASTKSLVMANGANKLHSVQVLDDSHFPNPIRRILEDPVEFPPLNAMEGLRRRARNNQNGDSNGTLGGNSRGKKDTSNENMQIVVTPRHDALSDYEKKPFHDICDITKGEEKVQITVANEVSSEPYPSPFYYIPKNIVYQSGYVHFSLARVGDEDCCPECRGDCLSAAYPCTCARESGGDFAYTFDGLVKKEILDQAIMLARTPPDSMFVYCKECPSERNGDGATPGKCKGHLFRRFIKECWSKCGCSMQCGNRVVQRGITKQLQVFLTPESKGWGLRTLEFLPRGSFVCEYVGEIVTNSELYYRNLKSENERHTYPVLLDADWGSERLLKDEEALCLDATHYGNVARFINHRCWDSTLIEIPVEIETPDHHYYHLAFFTARDIEPYEELTWDYGIDFEDNEHPLKAFKCLCGSRRCRDPRRSKRKRQQ